MALNRSERRESRIELAARRLAVAALVILFVVGMPLHFYYDHRVITAPLKIDTRSGNIFPVNNNGVVHFLEKFDNLLGAIVPLLIVVCFIVVCVALVVSRIDRAKK